MNAATKSFIISNTDTIASKYLKRKVELSIFGPITITNPSPMSLLLINDGQDTPTMHLDAILERLYLEDAISPILCVAISCGSERSQEYGVANKKDYQGRGAKAGAYTKFILKELLPHINTLYPHSSFNEMAFAGFSLGGLSALDIVWNRPDLFSKVGVFSGSLWWRSMDQTNPKYNDDKHRIMHQEVRNGTYKPKLKFFFECGKLDETGDRNHNGIIDSIDDTLDLIKELVGKGYQPDDICYLELENGKHDIATWGQAMPAFLKWGWAK